jgi:hypothetical protein
VPLKKFMKRSSRYLNFFVLGIIKQQVRDLTPSELSFSPFWCQGRTLRCSVSQVKHWLLVGNVPKGLSEEELQEIFNTNCPGVENIEFFKESFPSGLFGANISMSFR